MLLTGMLFVGVTVAVRYLGTSMNPVQAAFIRYCFGIVLILPLLSRAGVMSLDRDRLGFHALRGLVHGGGVILWFLAMSRIPISEVTALGFTTPIFVTLGAAVFLSERLKPYRVAAVLLGFIGALLILRPGLRVIDIGALAQLGAAPLFACSYLMAKSATRREASSMIVILLSVFCTLTLALPALMVWRTPTLEELLLLGLTALLATSGHYCMTRALEAAEVSAVQPFTFLQLVWATILGLILFDEHPDVWIWIGGAVIVASATWMAQQEVRSIRQKSKTR
ncbi:MAG TPA: EamA/RhaT family transporter [Gammaproteobacteria bacterium]|jgi:drug/metabolite transporter (DMT)-like permease|nr:EamA/RhaT family transporter [Gammaproteobacteria bacterium]|tara:strand:+ start:4349 stop:5191 length:843 start_codon:yes stop_codon:yes gene_type:complete